jgi:hypothetical protein
LNLAGILPKQTGSCGGLEKIRTFRHVCRLRHIAVAPGNVHTCCSSAPAETLFGNLLQGMQQ